MIEAISKFSYFFQMGAQELCHSKSTDFLGSEYLCHLFVWSKVLLVFGILKIVLLQISPQQLHTFSSGSLLLSNDRSQIAGRIIWLRESRFFLRRRIFPF